MRIEDQSNFAKVKSISFYVSTRNHTLFKRELHILHKQHVNVFSLFLLCWLMKMDRVFHQHTCHCSHIPQRPMLVLSEPYRPANQASATLTDKLTKSYKMISQHEISALNMNQSCSTPQQHLPKSTIFTCTQTMCIQQYI